MENTDIIITGSTAIWQMPLTQGDTLGTYSGRFEFRCFLSPTQMLEAGRIYRELVGNLGSLCSENDSNLAFCLSQLKFRVLRSPPFWSSSVSESGLLGDIPDLNVLALILDSAIRAETLFKQKIAKERESILDRAIKTGEDLMHKEAQEE
jgi:hypothetical protein